jgi:hypothetical protein
MFNASVRAIGVCYGVIGSGLPSKSDVVQLYTCIASVHHTCFIKRSYEFKYTSCEPSTVSYRRQDAAAHIHKSLDLTVAQSTPTSRTSTATASTSITRCSSRAPRR